jgi:hypothetical protein
MTSPTRRPSVKTRVETDVAKVLDSSPQKARSPPAMATLLEPNLTHNIPVTGPDGKQKRDVLRCKSINGAMSDNVTVTVMSH